MKRNKPYRAATTAPTKTRFTLENVETLRALGATQHRTLDVEDFAPYEPMAGVLPKDAKASRLAMDAGFDYQSQVSAGSLAAINAVFDQGYAFPGFSVLSNWAQIAEFRRPSETYAREVTRKWIKFQATGDTDKSEKLKKIEAEFKRLQVQHVVRKAIEQDGMFGRSQIYLDFGKDVRTDSQELCTELVVSPTKIERGSLKRLTVIEPIWSYPNIYDANDPLNPTFFNPTSWFVMGREIHSSRLLTIVSRQVPDILKPAYAFSGLSLSQMMKPYIDNWLRTRQSVSDLVHAFTVWTLKTDLSTLLNQGGSEQLYLRLKIFNIARDNHGVNAINNESEDFANVSAPLGSLDKLQAQAQEQMCAPSGLPLVYLTGITPSGLNATSQGEIEVFQDTLASNQEIYSPAIQKVLDVVQLSLFGKIDPEITFDWNPLKVVAPMDQATIRKTQADTDNVYIDAGVLLPDEVRDRLAAEEDSPYAALDLSRELPEPMMEHGTPGPNEEGLSPLEEDPRDGNAEAQIPNG